MLWEQEFKVINLDLIRLVQIMITTLS